MSGPLARQPLPGDVLCAADYEAHAQRVMDPGAWAYLHSFAGDGLTVRANRAGWDELELLPRVLRPLAGLDTGGELLGHRWPTPLLVAPMAVQRLAHADGERATTVAAAAAGPGWRRGRPGRGTGTRAARAPTWDDIAWLKEQVRLPLLLKGVLHPADAREAVARGIDGLVVSNHGGRTLDGACATARALPRIVDAAGGALPVLVDGGIRRGTDLAKALALGAAAVLVGRPVLWGLATAGAAGVAHVLRLLRDELEVVLAQCGARSPAELERSLLHRIDRN